MIIKNFDIFLNENSKKPNKYWTKERCKEEALKFQNRNDFQNNCGSAYNSSLKNKWLDEICSHMKSNKKPKNYWTKEKCKEEALKFRNKNEYRNNTISYLAAKRNGWLDEICSHMISPYKPLSYWTKEICKEEALKYSNRTDFYKKSLGAYNASKRNGWLKEICSHMNQYLPNDYCGYSYEFSDNYVYIGITSREKIRERTHLNKKESPVFRHIQKTGINPKKISLFPFTNSEIASKLEGMWVKYYISKNWNVLNIAHTGSLGGINLKWTKEKCKEQALKYNTRGEFRNKSNSAYGSALKNGWLDEICSHMIKPPRPVYWTYNRCKEESLKYKTRSELRNSNGSAYKSCLKNKWLDEFYPNVT